MSDESWIYRAEGNSSLVVADVLNGIVLRLRKRPCRNGSKKKKVCYTDFRQTIQDAVDFRKYVMGPFIGPYFIETGKLVTLEEKFLNNIGAVVEEYRKESRRDKECDTDCRYAIQMPDLCLLPSSNIKLSHNPVYCVEIKPKSGLLVSRDQATKYPVKYSTCKFCMHKHLKLLQGKWNEISGFCPLDLFSGNKDRMCHALKKVLYSPQNNLRLFKNGLLLYGDGCPGNDYLNQLDCFTPLKCDNNVINHSRSGLDGFIAVIIQCLLHEPSHSIPEKGSDPPFERTKHVCDASSFMDRTESGEERKGRLPAHCVLGNILRAQAISEDDIEQLWPACERIRSHFKCHNGSREDSEIDGPFHSSWLQPESSQIILNNSLAEDIVKVKKYLVSRSAQDCSIMIAVQPVDVIPSDTNADVYSIIEDSSGRKYRFSVSVIDTDVKLFDKFDSWKEVDIYMVEEYKKQLNQS